jgi:hypothetical protein
MKTNAEILNAIPSEMDLKTYFDSLTIFEKRELINELEVCKGHFSKNMKLKIGLALFSYVCSFLCYFGIREDWFIYYLIGINIPLSIFLFKGIQETLFYEKAISKLERRLSK